jgi:hypothetical protein
MSTGLKVPLERRRRNNLWEGMMGVLRHSDAPMRRQSDLVRSRMQRWIELADRALGKNHSGPAKSYPPELRNNKY